MRWKTKVINVDIDTGEIIPPWTAAEQYIFIKSKTKKHVKHEALHQMVQEITKFWRKSNYTQGKLFK